MYPYLQKNREDSIQKIVADISNLFTVLAITPETDLDLSIAKGAQVQTTLYPLVPGGLSFINNPTLSFFNALGFGRNNGYNLRA